MFGPYQGFTPNLVEAYNELKQVDKFEVIFISADQDDKSFNSYFSKMPWLAILFSDTKTREKLDKTFSVDWIPHLVFLDDSGKLLSEEGVRIIQEYGSEYPFNSEKIEQLKLQEFEARKNQSLKSLLAYGSRDYVIKSDGEKVRIAELEGKTIDLYFILSTYKSCISFNQKLVETYEGLKKIGKNFEIVMVPLDNDEQSFVQLFNQLPWLSLPMNDKCRSKLVRYFQLDELPTVVAIGPDGKTIHPNVADAIEEHGLKAFPFTPEKFAELEEIERAKMEAQTLESILVSGDLDFVIGKDRVKIPVSDLIGKTVLLYFSAHWCPPCRAFLPKLIQTYQDQMSNKSPLEIVFLSSDRDQASFDEYFSSMSWPATPFGDPRKQSLSRYFRVRGIPTLVAMGPDGKTVSTEARGLIMVHGPKAYPFTDERVKEIDQEYEKMAEEGGWPEKIEPWKGLHEHDLVLTKRLEFNCDGCGDEGRSYYCEECDFDLYPKCGAVEEKNGGGEGWVCEGDKSVKGVN
ncbi:Probable nucleoredoxin 1 [Striga hermonthica]|uniref:protein-disulfide reductase n=1 Tax=Striga hermonthica TaxID=68872 RepID=A0A9N7MYT4_STRHE|nr:Probable nucleoredoxin 1 [Striga hermonthica]